ncbi:MAG: UDP-N-acetylmuramoyl-L-alanine--D-glutamate ligase [Planctomycetes bacterium]|nr:UDP-N-acetylmuramoyl-L-alanine--D-glutamate ligase [Planctomycetota bacterium]
MPEAPQPTLTEFLGRFQRCAILGAGVEGLSALKFIADNSAMSLTICNESEFDTNQDFRNAEPRTGQNAFKSLEEFDLIVRSPGIRTFRPELSIAREKGSYVTSVTDLALKFSPCPVIGVTGTKGKGTTSTLLSRMLARRYQNVFLGGNIGLPATDFILNATAQDVIVLEISSFQLQDVRSSPECAVVVRTTQDHLDYHADAREYVEAKCGISKFQSHNDTIVYCADSERSEFIAGKSGASNRYSYSTTNANYSSAWKSDGKMYIRMFGKTPEFECLANVSEMSLIGEHNVENVLAATIAAIKFGIPLDNIRDEIRTFKGLPYRLEYIGSKNDRKFINDSFSTTPETAIAAINSFEKGKVIILLGGSDKGSDYSQLAGTIVEKEARAVLYGATRCDIASSISELTGKGTECLKSAGILLADTFEEAFLKAFDLSKPEDYLLLSPACASFDLFRNYKDRGDTFRKLFESL